MLKLKLIDESDDLDLVISAIDENGEVTYEHQLLKLVLEES